MKINPRCFRYVPLMLLSFVAYFFGLWALNVFFEKDSLYSYLLVVLPMIPMLYVVALGLRSVLEADEMQRQIALESLAFAGMATAVTCFTYSFLHDMGAPEFKAWLVWNFLAVYYFVGLIWSKWRYR